MRALWILWLIPTFVSSQVDSNFLVISEHIKIDLEEGDKERFERNLCDFLKEKNGNLSKSKHIDPSNLDMFNDVFNEFKEIERRNEDSLFYRAYLINFVTRRKRLLDYLSF